MSGAAKECTVRRAVHTQTDHHCPHIPYVELKVPSNVCEVVQVVFEIVSHDQGWADNGSVSYTWFEAVIVRQHGPSNQREIVRNRRASAEPFRHTISWSNIPTLQGGDWVRGLQAEDVIQVIPKAAYQAWVNFTLECQITIKYHSKDDARNEIATLLDGNDTHYCKRLASTEQQIRLLNVYPGKLHDPIAGFFSYVALSDTDSQDTNFDALSYCWGNPSDRAVLSLANDKDGACAPFSVTKSVYVAIRRLRSDRAPLKIWIDAVCINQNDLEERSEQVQLMSKIYSLAETVHIWLGEGSIGAAKCIPIIRDIYNFNHRLCLGGEECRCHGTRHSLKPGEVQKQVELRNYIFGTLRGTHEVFEMMETDFPDEIIELAGGPGATNVSRLMMVLYNNPWFTRVWVVQEASLARKALVHCSGETIPWGEVLAMSESLRSPKHMDSHIHTRPGMANIWHSIESSSKALALSNSDTSIDEIPQLHNILDVFLQGLDLYATDPRDKLFALFAFGKETNKTNELDELVRPDYTKSVELVFADFTRWWIKTHKSLSILSAIHWQTNREWRQMTGPDDGIISATSPSWTLDAKGNSKWARATLEAQFNFRAASYKEPLVELLETPDPFVLQLVGKKLSEISSIEYFPVENLVQSENRMTNASHIANVFERILDPSGLNGHWGTPLVRDESERTISRAVNEYIVHLNCHMNDEQDPVLQERRAMNIPTCLNRCYFISSDGKGGLCPHMAKEGDNVVLLDGANVPYLLRPTEEDGEFVLIGECFVDGIMFGEAEAAIEEQQVFKLV